MNRLRHVERHLRERKLCGKTLGEELIPLLHLLLTSLTQQQIADELGPGYTRKLVEHRYEMVCDALLIPPGRKPLQRVAILRVVLGLDPCFCEADVAA